MGIKDEIFDLVKLKMVQHILYQLTSKDVTFEPFDIKFRKKYLKASTTDSIKKQIGDKMLNITIPSDPYSSPILQNVLEEINKSNYYDIYDALSLLYHFHQIWSDHILRSSSHKN